MASHRHKADSIVPSKAASAMPEPLIPSATVAGSISAKACWTMSNLLSSRASDAAGVGSGCRLQVTNLRRVSFSNVIRKA